MSENSKALIIQKDLVSNLAFLHVALLPSQYADKVIQIRQTHLIYDPPQSHYYNIIHSAPHTHCSGAETIIPTVAILLLTWII